ncbi:MAG TPA: phage portal protein [Vicinamibacterales bacterium]|nr:phage portal protein [Vicinamibacterales bacterium]
MLDDHRRGGQSVNDAERQAKPDHPAALSLRYPNLDTTSDSFIRSLFTDYLIYKNAYALMIPAGNQIAFEHMPAANIEIRGNSLFRAEGYRYHRIDGTWVDFTPEQVLHWRGENPHDPRIGLSPLDTLRSVIAEDAALQAATVELANAGLTEPTWVFRPLEAPGWSNEARKGFEEDLTNRMRRRNKTPVVLEEGMEMRSFGVSPKDAEMMAVRQWAIERVASLYGVPLGMVGMDSNVKDAQSQFYADTLPPYCEDFTSFLNQRILVRAYNWTKGCFEFNLDEKHMGDDRLAALTSATGRPVMVTNEARARLNLPPVDGGDELVTPMNVLVGDNPRPSTDIMPIQDPNKPPQDGSYREEPKALTKAVAVTSRARDLDRQHRHISLAQGVIEKHYDRLERGLEEKSLSSVKANRNDWRRWRAKLAADIHGTLEQIIETEGEIYAFKLAGDFRMSQVRNYLRAMADGAADGINATIRSEVEENGVDAALSNRATHVMSAGISLGASATRWAREEAARQAPGTEQRVKVWIPNTNRHAEFGGDTVPLGSDWPAGFAPGSAPGCACSMAIE